MVEGIDGLQDEELGYELFLIRGRKGGSCSRVASETFIDLNEVLPQEWWKGGAVCFQYLMRNPLRFTLK